MKEIKSYSMIHSWLLKTYGKAKKCENIACKKKSNYFDWAKLINKEYEMNRDNFIQLCRSCHKQYDARDYPIMYKNLPDAVRKLRLQLGWEQSKFAYELKVTTGTICNWECGRRNARLPHIRMMVALAKKYKIKVSIDDFLT
jgi:DNA-binding transcriptional regulator YiaG